MKAINMLVEDEVRKILEVSVGMYCKWCSFMQNIAYTYSVIRLKCPKIPMEDVCELLLKLKH